MGGREERIFRITSLASIKFNFAVGTLHMKSLASGQCLSRVNELKFLLGETYWC